MLWDAFLGVAPSSPTSLPLLLFMFQVLQMLQEYFRQQQEHSEAMEQLLSLADKLSLSTTEEEVGSIYVCTYVHTLYFV